MTAMTQEELRRERNRKVAMRRRKRDALAALRGEPIGPVPAQPIRSHANELMALGWSVPAILAATGCPATNAGLRYLVSSPTIKAERKFLAILSLPITLAVPDSVPGNRLVPMLGATRRVRALQALGWTHADISEIICRASHHISAGRKQLSIVADDWRLIDLAYQRMSLAPGGSERTAERAARSKFAPPFAWNDIDNPHETPTFGYDPNRPNTDRTIDPVVISRVLEYGDWTVRCNVAERMEIIRRWADNDRAMRRLDELTGWNIQRDLRNHGAEFPTTLDAVEKAHERAGRVA